MIESNSTDFGYQQVGEKEKTRLVGKVFDSVASNYDLMNDIMSFGLHRLWKRYAVHISQVKRGSLVLDVAGGTGDMAVLYKRRVGDKGSIIVSDINSNMLSEGRSQLINKGYVQGIDYVQADAECLPFKQNSFDHISIAFGLRNVTNKIKALDCMCKKLKYGSSLIILEFSKLMLPLIERLYDDYSFKIIPILGKLIAKEKDSYQYLIESIRMHPDQERLKSMMETAGFSNVSYLNLSGGIVAIHRGYKI